MTQRPKKKSGGVFASESEGGAAVAPSRLMESRTARRFVSIALVIYLAILLLGPLSNPISPPHFIGPLAQRVSPVHRVLFQGHGYRFFAPNPGPSHRLIYRGTRADGTEFSGHFPDREQGGPRLLYHRWFMLSETVFGEHQRRQPQQQFEATQQRYDFEIENFRSRGKLKWSRRLSDERDRQKDQYMRTQERFEALTSSISNLILERNQGVRIELLIQERSLPFPEEVANGARLEDEEYLSSPIMVGILDADGFRVIAPPNPEMENLESEILVPRSPLSDSVGGPFPRGALPEDQQ